MNDDETTLGECLPAEAKPRRWYHRRAWRIVGALALSAFVGLNVVAYFHARAMTHFTTEGERTKPPEDLGWSEKLGVMLTGVRIPRPANRRTPAEFDLAFTVETLTAADGTKLEQWRIDAPAGRTPRGVAIGVPGYAAAKSTVLDQAKVLHELGFSCVLVDPRGVGGSDGAVTSIGYHEALDVTTAFRHARARDPNLPIVLFGYSGGAAAVVRAVATERLDPTALILEACFDTMLETVSNRFSTMGLPAFPMAHLLVFWGGAIHGFNGFTHDPATYAAEIRVPTLLLHGETDPRVPPVSASALRDGFAGPVTLEILTGLGHRSAVTEQPGAWREHVGRFLGERVPTGRTRQ